MSLIGTTTHTFCPVCNQLSVDSQGICHTAACSKERENNYWEQLVEEDESHRLLDSYTDEEIADFMD